MDRLFPVHVERLQELMAPLSATEKREAARLLRRLSRHVRHTTGGRTTDDD
jgi:hypothetical protein